MNEQDTHAGIIAEMRFHGQQNIDAEKDKPECGILTVEGEIAQNYADRLEAAHKREIEATAAKCCQLGRLAGYGASEIKHLQEPVGNAAKLLEALVSVKKSIDDMGAASLNGDPEVLLMSLTQVCARLSARIDSALAEPPRNCERFRNADEALEALERHCNSSGNGCIRCPVAGSSTQEVECKIAWLFAPATEKKGGAK